MWLAPLKKRLVRENSKTTRITRVVVAVIFTVTLAITLLPLYGESEFSNEESPPPAEPQEKTSPAVKAPPSEDKPEEKRSEASDLKPGSGALDPSPVESEEETLSEDGIENGGQDSSQPALAPIKEELPSQPVLDESAGEEPVRSEAPTAKTPTTPQIAPTKKEPVAKPAPINRSDRNVRRRQRRVEQSPPPTIKPLPSSGIADHFTFNPEQYLPEVVTPPEEAQAGEEIATEGAEEGTVAKNLVDEALVEEESQKKESENGGIFHRLFSDGDFRTNVINILVVTALAIVFLIYRLRGGDLGRKTS